MKGIIQNAIFEKYGICQIMDYEESENRGYLTFISNSALYVGIMRKNGSQIVFYKQEKAVILDED